MFSVQTLRVINHIKLNQKQIIVNQFYYTPRKRTWSGEVYGVQPVRLFVRPTVYPPSVDIILSMHVLINGCMNLKICKLISHVM